MRKKDPAGAFKISKANPQLMVPRSHEDWESKSETFYNLYTEGDFHNFDGFTKNFSRAYGLDLNRQFASGFRPEGEQPGAGPYPGFLPEAHALVKAVTARPNISVAHTYHTYGGMILRLPALNDDDSMNPQDLYVYKTVCEASGKKMGYPVFNIFKDFKYEPDQLTTGSFDEWLFSHRGILAATIEIWDIAKESGLSFTNPLDCYMSPSEEHLVAIYKWCETHLDKNSFHQNWETFQHPQLGEIEIGGWDWKFVFQNPPTKFLAAELEKVFQGTLSLAKASPLLKIESVIKTNLSASQHKVEVILKNSGYLPTNGTNQAIKSGAAKKPRVTMQLPESAKLITGKKDFEIEHLAGRSARSRRHTPVWYSEMPNTNECKLEWVIEGFGVCNLKINLERGGVLSTSFIL